MVVIKRQLISNTSHKFGTGNGKRFITVHMTDNWNRGANAQAHANLQSNVNPREASWHWQVDSVQAIQSFNHNFQLWASGKGRDNGNLNSIHVEICVNSDGNYRQALRNGAELVAHIMKTENISIGNVVQHNYWSGKNCPSDLRRGRDGITWSTFKSWVSGSNPPSTVSPPSTSNGLKVGQTVTLKTTAKTYATGQNIASFAKGKKYNIRQVKSDRVLLDQINSWVRPSDVQVSGSTGSTSKTFKVGQLVTLKTTAKTYATGQNIASFAKGKKYNIRQVKSDRVLLSKINSWVKKSDVM